ncbi:hypothetical protein [Streptomyces sp. NPDC058280]|uniref:hypothetical protein n=1 Tax=Streptomyces sp. NPDC058280 TaxID=3346419 RepID=UPI0036E2E533
MEANGDEDPVNMGGDCLGDRDGLGDRLGDPPVLAGEARMVFRSVEAMAGEW